MMQVRECHNIQTGYKTELSMVVFKFKDTIPRTTETFWKYNNSLLKGQNYV